MQLQRERTPADFATALPEVMKLSRYRGPEGPDILLEDICAALADLPIDRELKVQDSTWGRMILGIDQPTKSITSRREDLNEANGSARKYRDRFVIQAVLHRIQLLDGEASSSSLMYDAGFDVVKIAAELRATLDDPLGVRHKVTMKVRARRPGLRIVPLCYSAVQDFESVMAQTNSKRKIDIAYSGCSALATGNPALPIHFFWLSQPAKPNALISIKIVFSERYPSVWTEAHSRLRLLTDRPREVVLRASPPDAFERVMGYRIAPRSTKAIVRFDSGEEGAPRRTLEYRPRAAVEETMFEMRCLVSEKHLDRQRKKVRK